MQFLAVDALDVIMNGAGRAVRWARRCVCRVQWFGAAPWWQSIKQDALAGLTSCLSVPRERILSRRGASATPARLLDLYRSLIQRIHGANLYQQRSSLVTAVQMVRLRRLLRRFTVMSNRCLPPAVSRVQ